MLFVGMRLIYLRICDMRNEGDEAVSESAICMSLPPAVGFSFEFFLV